MHVCGNGSLQGQVWVALPPFPQTEGLPKYKAHFISISFSQVIKFSVNNDYNIE